MIIHGKQAKIILVRRVSGAPQTCERCGRSGFDKVMWMDSSIVYACRGCGCVHDPVDVETDVTAYVTKITLANRVGRGREG